MLLDGPGINQPPPESDKSKVATSIRQQITLNSVGHRSQNPGRVSSSHQGEGHMSFTVSGYETTSSNWL
jgi:hypothetical protein